MKPQRFAVAAPRKRALLQLWFVNWREALQPPRASQHSTGDEEH